MIKKVLTIILISTLFYGCQTNSSKNDAETKKELKSTNELTLGVKQNIKSTILNEERPIIISLPKGYDASKSNYPVLYLTDGLQNIWHVIGTLEVLTRTGNVPPMIVVGIESTNRLRDFTLTASKKHPGSGGGKKFLAFIEKELIPYVESNYRTNSFRVLEGHSLGGLFAASTLIEKPKIFQGFIIMSPALWWNGEELTKKAKTFFKSNPNLEKTLFFGIGKEESSKEFGMRKELTNFIDVIKANKPQNLNFAHKEFDGEGHMSSSLLSNYYGLKTIFADLKYTDEFKANYSDAEFLKKEKEIINKYGESAKRTGESYYQLGAAIYKKNLSGAITVFKRSVEVYPHDINLITTLAELYEKNKDISSAIDTYNYAIKVSKKYNFGGEKKYQKEIDRLKNN